jgi:hypothetical protein
MNKTRQGGRFDVALAHQDNGGVRGPSCDEDRQNHLTESNLSDPGPAGADRIATRAFYPKASPTKFRWSSLPAQFYRLKKMPAITFARIDVSMRILKSRPVYRTDDKRCWRTGILHAERTAG